MALSPAQKQRRAQLLAKKELRDTNSSLCAKLKLPLLLEGIRYENITAGLPAVLGDARKAQKLTVTAKQVIEVDSDGCPTADSSKGIQIEIYTTQERTIHLHSLGSVVPAYKPQLILQDISELPVQGAAILPPSYTVEFRLKFSSEENLDDMGRTPLELRLEPAELVVMIIDSENGKSWAMYMNLKGLADSLGISQSPAADNQTKQAGDRA